MLKRIVRSQLIPLGKSVSILSNKKPTSSKKSKKAEFRDESYLELTELLANSDILFKAKTVFPFILFPDEVIIDKDKVSIISQVFFGSDRRQSVLIKNVADCFVDTSILFGTLKITDKYFEDKVISISYLKKSDAIKARDIIQGLVICHDKKVDISSIGTNALIPYLIEIGKATES